VLVEVEDQIRQHLKLTKLLLADAQQRLNREQAYPPDAAFEITHLFKLRFGRLIGRGDNSVLAYERHAPCAK
jgi:hypothetical protein